MGPSVASLAGLTPTGQRPLLHETKCQARPPAKAICLSLWVSSPGHSHARKHIHLFSLNRPGVHKPHPSRASDY